MCLKIFCINSYQKLGRRGSTKISYCPISTPFVSHFRLRHTSSPFRHSFPSHSGNKIARERRKNVYGRVSFTAPSLRTSFECNSANKALFFTPLVEKFENWINQSRMPRWVGFVSSNSSSFLPASTIWSILLPAVERRSLCRYHFSSRFWSSCNKDETWKTRRGHLQMTWNIWNWNITFIRNKKKILVTWFIYGRISFIFLNWWIIKWGYLLDKIFYVNLF